MPTYYLDNNRGNNANNGLSPLTPWKDLSQIAATTGATAGDAFLLADDSKWILTPTQRVVPPTSWMGTEKNPVVISKYSPSSQSVGQRPLITMHVNTTRADWTERHEAVTGLNAWTYQWPFAQMSITAMVRINDTWLAHAVDTPISGYDDPVASVDGRFTVRSDRQTLVLYSPPGINPIDYYGKIVVGATYTGAFTVSSGRRAIAVRGIAFEETGCGVSSYSNGSTPTILTVEDCRLDTGTLSIANGDSGGNLRVSIRNNEVYDFGAMGIQILSSGTGGVTWAEVAHNRIDDGVRTNAQGGIYLQVRNSSDTRNCVVYGNEVSNCRWGSQDKAFDGCGIYSETGSDNVLIYGNIIHDCFIAMQDNSGRRTDWTGNLVYNCRRAMRISDESDNGESDCRIINNTFIVGDPNVESSPFGSTTGNAAEYLAIWCSSSDDPLSLTVRNNIFVNAGPLRARAFVGLPLAYGISTYTIDKNWAYGFEADVLVGSTNGVPSPAPATNTASTADPRPYLDTNYSLKTPYLLDGIPMLNPLGNAGAYVHGVRLMGGRRLDPGRVPIGAFAEGRY